MRWINDTRSSRSPEPALYHDRLVCALRRESPGWIRTHNGVPFATTAIHGLSHLNVWWIFPSVPGISSVKRVTDVGTFRFQHRLLYIANALVDQHIGLEETDDGVWSIYFNAVLLATFDERDFLIRG